MADARRMKAVQWARQEDLVELHEHLQEQFDQIMAILSDLSRHQEILELAVLKTAADADYLSDVLVDAGLLVPEEEVEEEDGEPSEDVRVDPDNPAHEVDLYDEAEAGADDDGMPAQETPEEREERIAAVRARRKALIEEDPMERFAKENEYEAMPDPLMDVADVPDEGIIIPGGSRDERD